MFVKAWTFPNILEEPILSVPKHKDLEGNGFSYPSYLFTTSSWFVLKIQSALISNKILLFREPHCEQEIRWSAASCENLCSFSLWSSSQRDTVVCEPFSTSITLTINYNSDYSCIVPGLFACSLNFTNAESESPATPDLEIISGTGMIIITLTVLTCIPQKKKPETKICKLMPFLGCSSR